MPKTLRDLRIECVRLSALEAIEHFSRARDEWAATGDAASAAACERQIIVLNLRLGNLSIAIARAERLTFDARDRILLGVLYEMDNELPKAVAQYELAAAEATTKSLATLCLEFASDRGADAPSDMDSDACVNFGRACFEMGRPTEAAAAWLAGMRKQPNDKRNVESFIQLLVSGDFDEGAG